MSSTLNGWLPAAVLALAVVDAVGDIRARPSRVGKLYRAGDARQRC